MTKYLDKQGVKQLVDWIKSKFSTLSQKIELLNSDNNTPGSIDYKIKNAKIEDLQQEEEIVIFGGSASEVMKEEE